MILPLCTPPNSDKPMTSNSAEYQKKYRETYNKRVRNVTVTVPMSQYREFHDYASSQGLSLSALMRAATDVQIRSAQLKSAAVESELKELKFLLSNIANNVNQMARHSNRVRHVADEGGLFQKLHELEQTLDEFVTARLQQDT